MVMRIGFRILFCWRMEGVRARGEAFAKGIVVFSV